MWTYIVAGIIVAVLAFVGIWLLKNVKFPD